MLKYLPDLNIGDCQKHQFPSSFIVVCLGKKEIAWSTEEDLRGDILAAPPATPATL